MAVMKSPKLRPYQRTAIESARRALTKSGSCILQMPTGAGKTRAATEIVAHSRGVIWFVCHRQEIERQVAKAFTAAGIDFGVVSPRGEFQPKKRVQIISVHTNKKHIKKLPSPKLVIWDECHHAPAKTWNDIRRMAKGARHLGLTATPERLDGKGLREWFAELVVGPSIRQLIDKGYLSDFRYLQPSDPDLTSAKLQAGDYKKADLGKIMNTPVLIGDAVREYKKHAKGKRALAFCASKEAARDLAAKFNAERIPAKHVHDKTPAKERDSAVQDLAAGRIKVLCNVEVFTEGFDLPAIDAVILMRPTKSPTLLLQMIGRGLRNAPGKDRAIILDHAGLANDHGHPDGHWPWSLDGGAAKARRAAMTRGPRRCPECKEVRADRVEVCSCGYEFPTGREIGEFDGVLTEVRGGEYLSRKKFGEMMRVSSPTVGAMISAGMPTDETRGIDRERAVKWLWDNWRSPNSPPTNVDMPEKYEPVNTFAKKVGTNYNQIKNWQRAGLPCADNGWVETEAAIAWIKSNVRVPEKGSVSRIEFARKIGVASGTVAAWIEQGMPADENSNIVVKDGMAWLKKKNSPYLAPMDVADATEYECAKDFAIRVGSDNWGMPAKLRELGLPCASNGWVHIEDGLKWYKKYAASPRGVGRFSANGIDVETRPMFARRIGLRSTKVFQNGRLRGIPTENNRFIHIQRGLEWVRDNTNIKIPASAWPKKAAKAKPKRREPDEQHLAA